jgi:hypothetical protein
VRLRKRSKSAAAAQEEAASDPDFRTAREQVLLVEELRRMLDPAQPSTPKAKRK